MTNMQYERGDQVLVQGFGGRKAMLQVWEVREWGLILCTEEEYNKAISGDGIVSALGFPLCDVKVVDVRTGRRRSETA